jgi:hypothetical protein
MVNSTIHLNKDTLEKISTSNYSYLGIYEGEKSNITGTVKTK